MSIWYTILAIEIVVILIMIWTVWSAAVGAPWVPTRKSKVRKMLMFAQVKEDDTVYDLGSGDGRIVIMAAEEFGANAVGIEADPVRSRWAKERIRRQGLQEKVEILRGNFFNFNIGDATVVTMYLGANVNNQLRDKFKEELKPGTRIISHHFILKDWVIAGRDEEQDLYLYIM